jgi:hypothetical protein
MSSDRPVMPEHIKKFFPRAEIYIRIDRFRVPTSCVRCGQPAKTIMIDTSVPDSSIYSKALAEEQERDSREEVMSMCGQCWYKAQLTLAHYNISKERKI